MEAMQAKVRQTVSSAEVRPQAKLFRFIGELKEELKKVSWTTKAELIFCTKVVIGATLILGFGIYFADLAIKGVLDAIGAFVRLLFG